MSTIHYDDGFPTLMVNFLTNPETQTVFLAGLCGVGAWVIFSWLLQLVMSILWPFFAVTVLLVIMPDFRRYLAEEVMPKQVSIVKEWTMRQAIGLQNAFNRDNF